MDENAILQLKNDCRQYATGGDRRALPALKKLRALGEQKEDPALLGFADYYTANYHHDRADYERARKYLVRSVHHLLRSNDYELLARAYNYFGVDASENGAFDIACSYFLNAMQFVSDREDSTARSLSLINLASLFSELGFHARARRYFRKGIHLMQRFTHDPFYARNMVIALSIEGMNLIALGEVSLAEQSLKKMRRLQEQADEASLLDAKPLLTVFETRLALEKNDRALVRTRSDEIVSFLRHDASPHISIDNTSDLLRSMLTRGFVEEAGAIADAVRPHILSGGVTYAMHLLAELQADYYERIRDNNALLQCLTEQNRLSRKLREEHKRLYRCSIEMIRLVGELKGEERKVSRENRALRVEAETDALTGIPNRYALEREVWNAFEEAYGTGTHFGVGLLDINNFKQYNDSHGHAAGDQCLVLLGKVLQKLSLDEDLFCARYGGDEFLILYRNMSDEEIAGKTGALADALSAMLLPAHARTPDRHLTVSQGICNDIPGKKMKPWDFLSAADAALYALKKKQGAHKNKNVYLLRKLPDTYR